MILGPGSWIPCSRDPRSWVKVLDPLDAWSWIWVQGPIGSVIPDPGSWIQDPGSRIHWIHDCGSWVLDPWSWTQGPWSWTRDPWIANLPMQCHHNIISKVQDFGEWLILTMNFLEWLCLYRSRNITQSMLALDGFLFGFWYLCLNSMIARHGSLAYRLAQLPLA